MKELSEYHPLAGLFVCLVRSVGRSVGWLCVFTCFVLRLGLGFGFGLVVWLCFCCSLFVCCCCSFCCVLLLLCVGLVVVVFKRGLTEHVAYVEVLLLVKTPNKGIWICLLRWDNNNFSFRPPPPSSLLLFPAPSVLHLFPPFGFPALFSPPLPLSFFVSKISIYSSTTSSSSVSSPS